MIFYTDLAYNENIEDADYVPFMFELNSNIFAFTSMALAGAGL